MRPAGKEELQSARWESKVPINEGVKTCPKCGQEYPAAAGIHPNCPQGEEEETPPQGDFFEPSHD